MDLLMQTLLDEYFSWPVSPGGWPALTEVWAAICKLCGQVSGIFPEVGKELESGPRLALCPSHCIHILNQVAKLGKNVIALYNSVYVY